MNVNKTQEQSCAAAIGLFKTIKTQNLKNTLVVVEPAVDKIAQCIFDFCRCNKLNLEFVSFDKKNTDLLVVKTEQHDFFLSFDFPNAEIRLNEVLDAVTALNSQ